MTKVLVTGASGFAGGYLIEHLLSRGGYEIVGTVFGTPQDGIQGWSPVPLDLTTPADVNALIKEVQPEWVFHLAALSSPAVSHNDHHQTMINNVLAQAHLLDALVAYAPLSRMLVVGSAEEYGKILPKELPIKESVELRPLSPYAVSKATQDLMGLQYYLSHNLDVVRVRPFNHIGPRQRPQFVVPAFAEQIAKIEAGRQEAVIRVGNLTSTRDFTDVRDMVAAYELAMQHGQAGEVYNLGSGQETSIQEILETLLSMSTAEIRVEQDPARMQPSDVPRLQADASKFSALTGWKPTIPLKETLAGVLHYWRDQVKKAA